MNNPRLTQFDVKRFEVYSPYGEITLCKYIGCDEVLIIPEGIEKISENAFDYENHTIKHISLPSTLKCLHEEQFIGFKALQTIDMSKTRFDTIPEGCFFNSSIREFTVQGYIQKIERNAFCGCPLLRKVTINETCQIHPYAFGEPNTVGFEESKSAVLYYPKSYRLKSELNNLPKDIKKKRIGSWF